MTATIATVLAAIVSRDFADDLVRAVTFGGGYRPTVRVMLQRHWGESFDRIPAIAATLRADVWTEGQIGLCHVGFRDNRDRASHAAALEALARLLKAEGFQVRVSRRDGLASALAVRTSKASDALVEAAAPLYIDRINAAIATADAA